MTKSFPAYESNASASQFSKVAPHKKRRSRYGTAWTVEQDSALTHAVEKRECKSWREVKNHVPGTFTHVQCAQRWNKVLKPGLTKGWWSPEEDKNLRDAIHEETGVLKWSFIAKCVQGRTSKQCRERWTLCLDPAIRRDEWTAEEDKLLMDLHALHGNSWTTIATEMEGLTAFAVKCRFHSLEKRRRREWTPAEDAILIEAKKNGINWSITFSNLPHRSKYAVRTRARQLGELRRAESSIDDDDVMDMEMLADFLQEME